MVHWLLGCHLCEELMWEEEWEVNFLKVTISRAQQRDLSPIQAADVLVLQQGPHQIPRCIDGSLPEAPALARSRTAEAPETSADWQICCVKAPENLFSMKSLFTKTLKVWSGADVDEADAATLEDVGVFDRASCLAPPLDLGDLDRVWLRICVVSKFAAADAAWRAPPRGGMC